MEPQNTRNTKIDDDEDRVDLLSKQITTRALAVLLAEDVTLRLKAGRLVSHCLRAQPPHHRAAQVTDRLARKPQPPTPTAMMGFPLRVETL
jgi:hypothetical protein